MKQSLLTAMYLSVCVLGILGVSVSGYLQPYGSKFYYLRSQFRRSDDCNICYGGECLPLDQSRCDYYVEADNMLQKDNEEPEGFMNPQLKNDVDNLIFTMIEKAALTPEMECIPYLSRYTDCTKETVCIGCKTCHCAAEGKWSCNTTTHCRVHEPAIDIDHKVLIVTIENLIGNIKPSREKRSVTNNPDDESNTNTMGLEQMSEWFYGSKPLQKHQLNNEETPATEDFLMEENNLTSPTTETIVIHSEHTSIESATDVTKNTDPDYLAFDEVLSNIAVDTKNYTRRKPPLDIEPNKTVEFDYMLVDDDNRTTTDNVSLDNVTEISYIVNFLHEDDSVTEPTLDDGTKIVIDLLESAKNGLFNETDYIDLGNNKEDLVGVGFDNTNDIFEYNAVNIMKRDVSSVLETTQTPNTTSSAEEKIVNATTSENNTDNSVNDTNLKDNVLLPVIKAINNIKGELEHLTKIKENLVNFMNSHNQSPIVEVWDYPNISDTNLLHDVEMFPDLEYDLRRTNPNIMQKFLYKLKADLYEVIKDILALQRYRQGELPDDLNILIHALKRYMSKNKPLKRKLKSKSLPHHHRRLLSNVSKCMGSTFKECMVEILQILDKDMPKDNALAPLSKVTKRIMRQLIRTYYTDELTSIGLRVHDPNYNMTNDLSTIGSKWQEIANNVIGSSPFVTLYRMKLLQIFLEVDINKVNDALALLDFAHSRRMTPYFQNVKSNVIDQINNGLKTIGNKVQIVVQYYSTKTKDDMVTAIVMRSSDDIMPTISPVEQIKAAIDKRQQKKRSFIKHIRNLLNSSKRDISELLHRQIPKSVIVKQLARKKLDEIAQKRYNEYEEAMKKWQKNLGIMPRYKRHALDEVASRIKNIIPKYLRRKVKPKLQDKKKNSTHKQGSENGKKKKKHGVPEVNVNPESAARNKHRKTTLTTATTPKTKATTPKSRITTKSHKTIGSTKGVNMTSVIH